MIRLVLGIFFVTLVDWVNGQGIIFRDDGKNHRPLRSLQIPITVIQGATVAAQPWSSQNENTINKIFNIPTQTLPAFRSSVINKNSEENKFNSQSQRRERILEARKQEIFEQKQLRQQQRLDQEKLQRDQHKKRLELEKKNEEDDDHPVEKRQARFFDIYGWSSALTDVLLEGFGHGHGHGYGGLWNQGGHGGHGGHGGLFNGHKKKKKKKKKPIGSHFGGFNHGNIWGGHGGHGGHGIHGGHGGHGSHGHGSPGNYGGYGQGSSGIYGGLQQIFGNLNHHYQVTENVDDIAPQRPIFGWQKPHRDAEKIENKIAPGFNDNS